MSEKVASGTVSVRFACETDVPACKLIADQNRTSLGFLTRGMFLEAVSGQKLLVAVTSEGRIVGFVRFNHRQRGSETAIYDICVDVDHQHRGVGRALVAAVAVDGERVGRTAVALRCPMGLPANGFYDHVGFQDIGVESGRKRELRVWRLSLGTSRCNS